MSLSEAHIHRHKGHTPTKPYKKTEVAKHKHVLHPDTGCADFFFFAHVRVYTDTSVQIRFHFYEYTRAHAYVRVLSHTHSGEAGSNGTRSKLNGGGRAAEFVQALCAASAGRRCRFLF